jgi:integrase
MAPHPTGQVVVRDRKAGRAYALRFRANGERQYLTLGTDAEGWDQRRAEEALKDELAKVRAGVWRPAVTAVPEPARDPTFHEFASEWWESKRDEFAIKTQVDYEWQLSSHLLPFFAKHPLSTITVAEVDRYRTFKVREREARAKVLADWEARLAAETSKARQREIRRERPPKPLSAVSINKTITRLGQILNVAEEYGVIERNPVRVNPRNRKLKAVKPPAVWLDRAEQIEALLQAAAELDTNARPDKRHVPRQALLATLVYAGLRVGELLSLRWRDIDLAAGRLQVAGVVDERRGGRRGKTDASVRQVDILPALRSILATYKMGCENTDPDALVFRRSTGTAYRAEDIRNRTFAGAVRLANEKRVAAGYPPLPEGLTPHKLRHTCCSLLFRLRLRAAAGDEDARACRLDGDAPNLCACDERRGRRAGASPHSSGSRHPRTCPQVIGHHWAPAPRIRISPTT